MVDKFIELAVPPEMQSLWKPDSFTGSLLVLFENGNIESSSLIEKKHNRVQSHDHQVSTHQNENESGEQVTVVNRPFDSFTILKSPSDSKMNIYFTLETPAKVFVIVYNELQQVVRQIEKRFDRPGDYSIAWDGPR
ncbi:hypothetical protein GWO43_04340 [candidate division KSB1 bacterium]|nr:hypothetical protein [candidate division KSB1 bacterium]NIR70942.1 hypothetical protein [candidate division KSB1 bacterium]NIS23246.1 hypothetical protein [candidate division KSB1 bacterium]NIT70128.1 hypothetical protein [candidate division KSB1 bacterium]NIU27862.1 hypothetical protein [candidate division KSB1 bacterium]